MFRKKHYLAFGAVGLVALLLLSLPASVTTRVKLAAGGIFLPLFGLHNTVEQLPADLADSVLPRRELLRQFNELRRENDQLKAEALQNASFKRENDQLRTALGWQRQVPWKLKLARVTMRDPANWWRTVQIDLGTRDGLAVNMPVLTPQGLVGRIASVTPFSAQVVLLGDPNCKASALVENAARDMGVVSSGGPLDNSYVQLTYLSGNANLKPGQNVLTSGLGGIFPKGILIGQVMDSQQSDFGLYTEARVKLAVNLGALEQVWVLTNPSAP